MALQGKTIRIMVPFDMLFSIDIGIIRFLAACCTDEEMFNLNQLKSMSDREILSLIQSRKDPNPLSILDIRGDINKIYQELIDDYEEEIIQWAPITDFAHMIYIECGMRGNGVDTYIRISNEFQRDKLMNKFFIDIKPQMSDILVNDCVDVNFELDGYYLNSYTDLYHHNIRDSFYTKMEGKTIYLSDTSFNKDFLEKRDFGKLSGTNIFNTIKLWREVNENGK